MIDSPYALLLEVPFFSPIFLSPFVGEELKVRGERTPL